MLAKERTVYFNDNEKFVAEWLRNLYPHATVDSRSVLDVRSADVAGYNRVHLYAGIGGWEYALQLAGWGDKPVWTASLPCQPFSTAGLRRGADDERHLWPVTRNLIDECRPPVVFGEQVASKLGREWLAGVRVDLEALGYAVGCADLCAAGVSAPHIRQRLCWVAYSERDAPEQGWFTDQSGESSTAQGTRPHVEPGRCSDISRMANAFSSGVQNTGSYPTTEATSRSERENGKRKWFWPNPWERYDLIYCLDGRIRRIPTFESGIQPVVNGIPTTLRKGGISGAGGAIVPQVAATFIQAFMESVNESL